MCYKLEDVISDENFLVIGYPSKLYEDREYLLIRIRILKEDRKEILSFISTMRC